ncbi:MAG: TonB-dependent receptor, partial [Acidobacteria bacterium]
MKRHLWRLLFVLGLSASARGQEFRATLNGRVTDPAGLPVPGVGVTVINVNTNETATALTGDAGNYTIPFLKPGVYTITAEQPGFKKFTREKQQLSVGQTATIDIQLEVGQVTETVTITAEAQLLETSKADRGTVIERQRVSELPLNARNPFMLSLLVAGVNFNGAAIYHRPFDNGAIADWNINGGLNRGGAGGNEFLLDGAPNNSIQGGNNLAYVPPVDSVEEFKIMTNSYDAQYGRTSGGVINVSLKSGTNRPHGTVYEFARRDWLDANYLLTNAQFVPNKPGERPPTSGHFLNQYGFEVDGPVYIPKLYDGRNRTFFMYQLERYREGTPNPATLTYPDERQRRGDFSQLFDRNGNLIQIYDPLTGRADASAPGGWARDPFPNNIIPQNRIDPIAAKIISLYPLPNATTAGSDPWRNNYAFTPNLAFDTFINHALKVDQVLGSKDKMFFRYGYNTRTEWRYTEAVLSGPASDGQLPLQRINYTGVVDWVHTFDPKMLLNVRIGGNRYIELARSDPGFGYDATQLGFPRSLVDQLPVKMFPRIDASDYSRLGRGDFTKEPTNAVSIQPNLAVIRSTHSIRTGVDIRMTQYSRQVSGSGGMRLEFTRGFTQRVWNQGDALSGNSIASMLLGTLNSTNTVIDNNAFPIYLWPYYAPWVQDDWKLTRKLTLNLGLRWDLNGPIRERFDRENRGFDPNVVNPVSSSLTGLTVKGGIGFVGINGNPRTPWDWDKNNIQPRAGFAYSLGEKTVLRGGFGQYYMNPTGTGFQTGFSVSTPYVSSPDGGRTPFYNLANPFPQGVTQPPGSSQGLQTFLGRGPSYSSIGYSVPYIWQFSFGIQRQLPWETKLEASYVASRGRQLQTSWTGVNEPPDSFRKLCDVSRGGNASYCNDLLPNPFFNIPGFEGTSRFTNSTISRSELNRPMPQFTGITENERNDGRTWYNSLQVTTEKRHSHGLTLVGTYTLSKMVEESGFLDSVLMTEQRSLYTQDRPHRLTVSGIWDLPFGRNHRLLGGASRWADTIAGGWQWSGLFVYNSGRPWDLPDTTWLTGKDARNPNPDANRSFIQGVSPCVAQMSNSGVVTMQAFSVAAGCTEPYFIIRPSFAARNIPSHSGQIRRPSFREFDVNLAKNNRIR